MLQERGLPPGWDRGLPTFPADSKGMATRDSSGKVLNAIAENMPWLLGCGRSCPVYENGAERRVFREFSGTCTGGKGDYKGRNFHFGLREHAMCAIANGMSLSKLRPYAASFLIFTDYCRAAIRLTAMMEIPVIYIWTHDSINLGEDVPRISPSPIWFRCAQW
jgi:transketolase